MFFDEEYEQWLDDSLVEFFENIDYELEAMAQYFKEQRLNEDDDDIDMGGYGYVW